jgi:hypothetical protein
MTNYLREMAQRERMMLRLEDLYDLKRALKRKPKQRVLMKYDFSTSILYKLKTITHHRTYTGTVIRFKTNYEDTLAEVEVLIAYELL